jgi:hypothetical protein
VSTLLLVSAAVFAFLALWVWLFPFTGDGDAVLHYHNARDTFYNIAAGLSAWSRPAFVIPTAPFAHLGMAAARLFGAAVTIAVMWQTVRLAEDLNLRAPLAAAFMVLFQASAFALAADVMTEMPMALGVVVAVRLWINGGLVASALLVGFLPMFRPEGYFLGVTFGLFALFARVPLKRKVVVLAAMAFGLVFWSAACRYYINDWGGFLPEKSWPMNAVAPKGPLWWYVARWPECCGLPLFILFVPGLWQITGDRSPRWRLIAAVWFTVIAVHSVLFWRGIFASWGLIRILACVSPMTAVICLRGWNVLANVLKRRRWPRWTWRTPGLVCMVAAAGLWAVAYYFAISEHYDCFPIMRTVRFMRDQKLFGEDHLIVCGNQMVRAALDTPQNSKSAIDLPVDVQKCWQKIREFPVGTYLVWDNNQSPLWYHLSVSQFKAAGFTEIHAETTRTPASMLLGFEPIHYVLLRKDAESPEKPPAE